MTERSTGSLASRLFSPIAQVRDGEALTALLMFAYSFLAMTSYNIVKPITRSQFIGSLGADNLPWVQFAAGVLIGVIMQGYSRAIAVVPRRWVVPVTQAAMVALLVAFWVLFTRVGAEWVSVAFYLFGLILGILLISQFWTIANDVYDARQAKRLFGLIGGGASLGGATGAGLTTALVEALGQNAMLLVSAAILLACLGIVTWVIAREQRAGQSNAAATGEEERVSGAEALRLLLGSRHLQVIALVIGFAAIGAAIIEQQLNMAAAESKGSADAIAAFLAQIILYLSLIGFFIQVVLTSRIHRYLGIGFALLILPVSLGSSGILMLVNGALWTAGLARVLDTSLRYTVDKTSREILFLPLPPDLKYRAKPFIDVTVDRLAKGLGALLILVLIKDWGLGLTWQQLSYASLAMTGLWILFALRARREYLTAFRRSLDQEALEPAEIRLNSGDLTTVETLVAALAGHDPRKVVYAIDLLESLDKRHLVTPLLLFHESPVVRARALGVAAEMGPAAGAAWLPGVERALTDPDPEVGFAAVRALAALRRESAADAVRGYLVSADPRMAVTAATALTLSAAPADVDAAEDAFRRLASDTRDLAADVRLEVARALGHVEHPRFRPLLVPLMYDTSVPVALEAIRSAGRLGAGDYLFVPPLVSLLRHRLLKRAAREVLVGYGEGVVEALAYFLEDPDEDVWVRRHVPGTLARIPTAASLAVLVRALDAPDGFVRFKAMTAIGRLRRDHPELAVDQATVERRLVHETTRAFGALTLHHNLFVAGGLDADCLLARALTEKHRRAVNRMFLLLGLVHPPQDIAAVRRALARRDPRGRSSAVEYLDNLLAGDTRRRVMLLVEDLPAEERIQKGNVLHRTRVRDVEDTLAQLIHDRDQVVAAAAIQFVEAHGLWALADDVEQALARRDAADWFVFEAASWASAAARLTPGRRQSLWQEPLPAVEVAERLRHVPLFAFASAAELFRVAALGRQARLERGRQLYEAGQPVDTVYVLLEGRLGVTVDGQPPDEVTAVAPLGFEEALEGQPAAATVVATEPSVCLSLTTEQFLSLLAENVEIAQGIFRMLLEHGGTADWRTVLHGRLAPEVEARVAAGLRTVDRVLLLEGSPLLARATADELVSLAGIGREIPLVPDHPVLTDEPAILVVLAGALRVVHEDGREDAAAAGDAVGIYETLGNVPIAARIEVTAPGMALRFGHAELMDLIADHVELLQGLFSGLLHARHRKPAGTHAI
ncbi:MAG: Npt1/Npt2 family nucleotide transporter [Vicinamibacterales bacterium]